MAQAGQLVSDGDELLGQFFKPLVVGHQWFDLWGLLGGDAFGELPALDVALQDEIGTLAGFGMSTLFFEELAAEGAAAKLVDGLDLLEDLLTALFELGAGKIHVLVLYLYRYNIATKK